MKKYMWAWSRDLENTVPALASADHIRQQFIKKGNISNISAKRSFGLVLKMTNTKTKAYCLISHVVKS